MDLKSESSSSSCTQHFSWEQAREPLLVERWRRISTAAKSEADITHTPSSALHFAFNSARFGLRESERHHSPMALPPFNPSCHPDARSLSAWRVEARTRFRFLELVCAASLPRELIRRFDVSTSIFRRRHLQPRTSAPSDTLAFPILRHLATPLCSCREVSASHGPRYVSQTAPPM